MTDSIRKDFVDLEFTVIAVPHEYYVEYTIYDHETLSIDGCDPSFHRAGSHSHPDPVDTVEEAEPYLHGQVKWDGCSNWYFDEQDRVMLHGCSRENVQRFGDIMAACWDWTQELIPAKWLYD